MAWMISEFPQAPMPLACGQRLDGRAGFDDHDVRSREPVLEDVVEDDVTDVHLLRDADDAEGPGLQEIADGGPGTLGDHPLVPGEPAYAVQRDEPPGADDEGVDLELLDNVRVFSAKGRVIEGWVEVCAGGFLKTEEVIRFDHQDQTYAIYRTGDAASFTPISSPSASRYSSANSTGSRCNSPASGRWK